MNDTVREKEQNVLIEFKLKGGPEEARREDYKEGRYNYITVKQILQN